MKPKSFDVEKSTFFDLLVVKYSIKMHQDRLFKILEYILKYGYNRYMSIVNLAF